MRKHPRVLHLLRKSHELSCCCIESLLLHEEVNKTSLLLGGRSSIWIRIWNWVWDKSKGSGTRGFLFRVGDGYWRGRFGGRGFGSLTKALIRLFLGDSDSFRLFMANVMIFSMYFFMLSQILGALECLFAGLEIEKDKPG